MKGGEHGSGRVGCGTASVPRISSVGSAQDKSLLSPIKLQVWNTIAGRGEVRKINFFPYLYKHIHVCVYMFRYTQAYKCMYIYMHTPTTCFRTVPLERRMACPFWEVLRLLVSQASKSLDHVKSTDLCFFELTAESNISGNRFLRTGIVFSSFAD